MHWQGDCKKAVENNMEKNVSFPLDALNELSVRLGWAQLELYADDVDQIQVIASGDDRTLSELRIAVKDGVLVIEQPQYGLSLDITRGHWMQLCVRMPKSWDQAVRANTVSGSVSVRGLGCNMIELETVAGDIKTAKLTAEEISIRTTSGAIHGEQLMTRRLAGRSVSGDITLDNITASSYRFTSVSGDIRLKLEGNFTQMDLRTVSGELTVLSEETEAVQVSLHTVSGRKKIESIKLTEQENAPAIRATSVSGDLKIIGLRG